MPGGPSDVVLKDLHTLFQVGTAAGLTDGQLVEHFLSQRDDVAEAAFRALVERHAPMVLRICRDVVGDWHEAEDASQAAFIVLARKAGSIRKRGSVASWLFGVAYRIAAQSRAKAARRQRHEQRSAELAGTKIAREETGAPWLELYEEIDRLPERLREPLVLCYLKGHSQPEAAALLRCPVRTLQNRLASGQERLRSRLTQHGLHPAIGLWESAMVQTGSSTPIASAWLEKTGQAAMASARHTSTVGLISASASSLAEEMLGLMFRAKLKLIAAGVLTAAVLTTGLGILAMMAAGAPPQDHRTDGTVTKARQAPAGELIVRAVGIPQDTAAEGFPGITAIDPDTGKWRSIHKSLTIRAGPVSPDGRFIVYSDLPPDEVGVWIYDMKGEVPPRRIFKGYGASHWTNHGRQVVIGAPLGERGEKIETWRVNADGTGLTKLPIPDNELVVDCSADGEWLATRTQIGEPRHWGRLRLVHPNGTGARTLTEGSANVADRYSMLKISPDGQRVAYVEVKTVDDVRRSQVFIGDIDGKTRRAVPISLEPGTTASVCWSPNGSRLAVTMVGSSNGESIAVIDRDGTNLRNLPLPPGRWNFFLCDWKVLTPEIRVGARVEPDRKTPQGRYLALKQEVQKAANTYEQASRKAKPTDERSRIYQELFPHARPYAPRFLEIAESAPNDPAGLDSLVLTVAYGEGGPAFSRAIDLLVQRHAATRKAGLSVSTLARKSSPAAERLIRAVIGKNPDTYIKGLACLALGQYLKQQADRIRDIRDDPETARAWEALFLEQGTDKEGFARFCGRDPDAMLKEAEGILERAGKEFGVWSHGDTLSDAAVARHVRSANAELYEIRNLSIGKPAPDISGQDIDGKPFKLSDYRGKVVCLSFWADWSGSCRAMLPLERSLVERMRGKPFALLGVNGDSDKSKLRAVIEREKITWQTWFDGGGNANSPGPIARQFHVSLWPTIYIIDHKGVIRRKMLGNPASKKFSAAIDALVAAAQLKGTSAMDRP